MYNILKSSSSLFSGEYFIIDEDIKEFSTLKMDSVGRAMLTVLLFTARVVLCLLFVFTARLISVKHSVVYIKVYAF